MATAVVYGIPNCGYCEKAKALLTLNDFTFEYIDASKFTQEEKDHLFTEIAGLEPAAKRLVPVIVINGKHIGGYDQLVTYMDKWNTVIESIKADLKKGEVVTLMFTKKSGEQRMMNCTTNIDRIPAQYRPNSVAPTEKIDPNLFKVFDIDITAWRSFRAENIISRVVSV